MIAWATLTDALLATVSRDASSKKLDRDVDSEARSVFLEKHPLASTYAEFADFAFYEIDIEQAHLVAGFGRVETLGSSDL